MKAKYPIDENYDSNLKEINFNNGNCTEMLFRQY